VESKAPFCELWFQPICGTVPRKDLGNFHCWVYNTTGCHGVDEQTSSAEEYFSPEWERAINELNHSLTEQINALGGRESNGAAVTTTVVTTTTITTTINSLHVFLKAYVTTVGSREWMWAKECALDWLNTNQARSIDEVIAANMTDKLVRSRNLGLRLTNTSTPTTTTLTSSTTERPLEPALRDILERRVGDEHENQERWQEVRHACEAALTHLGVESVLAIAAQNDTSQDSTFLQGCGFRGVALRIELQKLDELRESMKDQCDRGHVRCSWAHAAVMGIGIATLCAAVVQALLCRDAWGMEARRDGVDPDEEGLLDPETSSAYSAEPLMDGHGRARAGPLVVSSVHQLTHLQLTPPAIRFDDDASSVDGGPSVGACHQPRWYRCVDLVLAYIFLVYTLEVWATYGRLVWRAILLLLVLVALTGYFLPCWDYCRKLTMTRYFTYQLAADAARVALPLYLLADHPDLDCPEEEAQPWAAWAGCVCVGACACDMLFFRAPRIVARLCGWRHCWCDAGATQADKEVVSE
jgi:hypothetical protein